MKRVFLSLLCMLAACVEGSGGTVWLEWSDKTQITEGSAGNPVRLGSAQDFDSYMKGLPEDTTIHLMAGTFQTETYFKVKSGWDIVGEGIDRTIVQVIDLGATPKLGVWWQSPIFIVFGSAPMESIRNARVCDLTVDCNFQHQTYAPKGLNFGAVGLHGDNVRVERVKAIHFGSTKKGSEDFVIDVAYWGKQARVSNLAIDGCIVTEPATNADFPGGATCLQIGALPPALRGDNHERDAHAVTNTGPGWSFGGEVKNCQVSDVIQAAGNAIGAAYQAQCRIHDNTIINCPGLTGVYGENISYDGLEVSHNFVSNAARGMLVDDYGFDNIRLRRDLTIRGNTIQNVSSLGISLVGSLSPKANGYENVAILDNVVSGGPGHPAIRVEDATNVVVANNVLNAPQNGFQLWLGRDGNVVATNNNNFDGSKVKELRQ